MRTIIAGSRGINDFDLVIQVIASSSIDVTEVVSGGARGVDQLGERFANAKKLPLVRFIPDWEKFGKGAGFRRNEIMAQYAEALIAVWDGKSRGTKHMVDTMRTLGKPVYLHIYVDQ